MNRLNAFGPLFLLLACGPAGLGAVSAYPFPQNQAQPFYCAYPTYSNADVTGVYNAWKSAQVTTNGAGGYRRVQRNGDPTLAPLSTVSEGIAYGMIIAVYMDDQPLFDDLWRYHNLHLDGNGLMNWYILADGSVGPNGNGAATDADQDIAWALVMAHYQWGTSAALPQSYLTYANQMITKVWDFEVEKPSMVLKPGDGWGGAGTLNVSYFDPSMYRVFAQISGNTGWLSVVDVCYQALFASLNAVNQNQNNGLVPAWSNLAGQPVVAFAGAPTHFQYDSCRTPFRIAKDWAFFGEPRALSYCAKLNSFYVPKGADNITDGYDLNGAERPQYDTLGGGDTGQSAAFVAPAMTGAMIQPGNGAFTQLAYDRLKTNTLLIGGPYYDQCWTVMGLLMASGNYLNYAPTPTPTPTPDPCQTQLKVNVAGAAMSGFVADKAYSAGSWGYLAAQAGAVGTSAGPISGATYPALYLDERYGTDVRYRFTAPNGPASLTLHWAETFFTSAGQRRFDVTINGALVENDLDLYTAAGGQNRALTRTYNLTVATGQIDLVMQSSLNNATLMALELATGSLCTPTPSPTRTSFVTATASPTRSPTPSISPTRTPSPTASPSFTASATPDACTVVRRLNAGGPALGAWAADQAYSAGSYGYVTSGVGTAGTSTGPYTGDPEPGLFTDERWGDPVRYRFDVPNGAYTVRLKLAESYFDTAGNRSVTYLANGVTVMNNVDLFTWAGGKFKARDLTFTVNVVAGRIDLESSSSNNNGTFMAIEVIGQQGCTPTPTLPYTLTVSPTRTRTPSATGTPSASPSASATRSPSPSASPTASPTPSASPSPSPTGSPTRSATPTATPSITATRTPTPTSSWSPSASPSASPSSSASPSPSSTATPTSSATRTRTPTGTATATTTATPSITPTYTDVPPGSTETNTPSISPTGTMTSTSTPTFSATPSATATPSSSTTPTASSTGTATPSDSATPSATGTPSSTASASSTGTRTATASPTPTGSPSPSATASATSSQSATPTSTFSSTPTSSSSVSPTGTMTPTGSITPSITPTYTDVPPGSTETDTPTVPPTPSATGTASSSATLTSTPTQTPSATPTSSPTVTPSATPTFTDVPAGSTATNTPTASPSPTPSLTPSPGAVLPSATRTPAPVQDDGPPLIVDHRPWPNPGPGWLGVKLRGSADAIRLRVYSRAFTCVASLDLPGGSSGWRQLPLPSQVRSLGAGVYFYTLQARRGGQTSAPSRPGSLMLLP